MKTYYGNYLGVVIAGGEKDPEGRGRCQIFIPHIMPALYEGWNNSGNDVSFDIVGDGLPTSLDSSIVNKLQKILPWAECAAPIVGSSPSTKDGSEETRNTAGKAGSFGVAPGAFEGAPSAAGSVYILKIPRGVPVLLATLPGQIVRRSREQECTQATLLLFAITRHQGGRL